MFKNKNYNTSGVFIECKMKYIEQLQHNWEDNGKYGGKFFCLSPWRQTIYPK